LSDGHLAYHAGADRWIRGRAALPTQRRNARLVATFGKLYMIGGESELGWLRDCEGYDPTVDRWANLPPLHEPIDAPGATAADGVIYVSGALRAGGALIEECRIATKLYVHARLRETPAHRPEARNPPPAPSVPAIDATGFRGLVEEEGAERGFELQPLSR
jgi:hypothetical protein